LPTVNAPTIVPTASPRRDRNQVEIIFMAGGYTPARQNPQANRVESADEYPSVTSNAALLAAPRTAATANRRRDGTMSARFRTAIAAVPATKPSCTVPVNHPTCAPVSDHSLWS
jgi:hypothetical protein